MPPAPSTSGSEAGRLTCPGGPSSLIAPVSPEEATTVTWRSRGLLQRRVDRGHLGPGDEVLTVAAANRDHRRVQGDGVVDHPVAAAVKFARWALASGWDQHDVEGGAERDRVDHLGVLDLLVARDVGRADRAMVVMTRTLAGGQAEPAIEGGQVLAYIGGRPRGLGQLGQDHDLAAAADAPAQQRRDAVGHLVCRGL